MKNFIQKIALWLLVKCGTRFVLVPEGQKATLSELNTKVAAFPAAAVEILPQVREVVGVVGVMDGLLSNEYRHAHAYATLVKQLPNAKHSHIGLAIEMVINGIQ